EWCAPPVGGVGGRVPGRAGVGEWRAAAEVRGDGGVACGTGVAKGREPAEVGGEDCVARRARPEKAGETPAAAGDGRVASGAGIVEACESVARVGDGGIGSGARVEKLCNCTGATVGDDRIARRATVGERQYRTGWQRKARRVRGVVDDAGAGKGQAARDRKTERIGRRPGVEGKSAEARYATRVER